MEPTLVTCYINPDLDGFACAIAYKEYLEKQGKKAVLGIFGEPHIEATWVAERFGISYASTDTPRSFSSVVLVDASTLQGLHPDIRPESVREVYDHRKNHDGAKFLHAALHIEFVGAAATLIAEEFHKNNVPISRESAALLYSAILSNTVNFQNNVTTKRDHDMAVWLNSMLGLPTTYVWEMFAAKSDLRGERLQTTIRNDYAERITNGKKLGISQIETIDSDAVIARTGEVVAVLRDIQKKHSLDVCFLTIVDAKKRENVFIAADEISATYLTAMLAVPMQDFVGRRPGIIMRKEIGAILAGLQ